MTITSQDLPLILERHLKWLRSEEGGSRANLTCADLSRANLSGADLSHADLYRANLSCADLSGADLSGADLSHADLYRANLSCADLSGANLTCANLSCADLSGANLTCANLTGADLKGAKNAALAIARTRIIPAEGAIVGWKKCAEGAVVKLRIPDGAKRSHAFGRKCRAERAEVLAIFDQSGGESKSAVSLHDGKTRYIVGETVHPDSFDDNWQEECAAGIHFYITREEAEAHS